MDNARYSLRPEVWGYKEHFEREAEVYLYSLAGLSPDDDCVIVYGGKNIGKWFLHWYRAGRRIETPNVGYDSPEEACAVAVEINEKETRPRF